MRLLHNIIMSKYENMFGWNQIHYHSYLLELNNTDKLIYLRSCFWWNISIIDILIDLIQAISPLFFVQDVCQ